MNRNDELIELMVFLFLPLFLSAIGLIKFLIEEY